MNETLKDFAIGDAYQSDFEQCQSEALEQMYTHARCLTESIEHLIDDEEETLLVDNLDIVFTTILQIKDLAFYSYTAERTDRWQSLLRFRSCFSPFCFSC